MQQPSTEQQHTDEHEVSVLHPPDIHIPPTGRAGVHFDQSAPEQPGQQQQQQQQHQQHLEAHQATVRGLAAPDGAAHTFALFDDEDEDDGEEGLVDDSPEQQWWLWLCGASWRTSIWTFIRREVLMAFLSIAIAITGAIVGASCKAAHKEEKCAFIGGGISDWLQLLAFAVAISIPVRVGDKLLFSAVSAAASSLPATLGSNDILNTIVFYFSAFEGAVARLAWIGLVWSAYDLYLDLPDPFYVERGMLSLLVLQVLAVIKNLVVRTLLRTFLISSFESKINDTLFGNLALLAVTQVHPLDYDGRLIIEKDGTQKELSRLLASTDFRSKLDYIARMRFKMYNKSGVLVPVGKDTVIASLAKHAYKQLSRLPATALVNDIDVYDRKGEEITEGLYGTLPDNLQQQQRAAQQQQAGGGGGGGGNARLGTTRVGGAGAGTTVGDTPLDLLESTTPDLSEYDVTAGTTPSGFMTAGYGSGAGGGMRRVGSRRSNVSFAVRRQMSGDGSAAGSPPAATGRPRAGTLADRLTTFAETARAVVVAATTGSTAASGSGGPRSTAPSSPPLRGAAAGQAALSRPGHAYRVTSADSISGSSNTNNMGGVDGVHHLASMRGRETSTGDGGNGGIETGLSLRTTPSSIHRHASTVMATTGRQISTPSTSTTTAAPSAGFNPPSHSKSRALTASTFLPPPPPMSASTAAAASAAASVALPSSPSRSLSSRPQHSALIIPGATRDDDGNVVGGHIDPHHPPPTSSSSLPPSSAAVDPFSNRGAVHNGKERIRDDNTGGGDNSTVPPPLPATRSTSAPRQQPAADASLPRRAAGLDTRSHPQQPPHLAGVSGPPHRRPSDPGPGAAAGASSSARQSQPQTPGSGGAGVAAVPTFNHLATIGAGMRVVGDVIREGLRREKEAMGAVINIGAAAAAAASSGHGGSGSGGNAAGWASAGTGDPHQPDGNSGSGGDDGHGGAAGTGLARGVGVSKRLAKDYPRLTPGHLAACIDPLDPVLGCDGGNNGLNKALSLFDANGDGIVSREEFIAACEQVWADLRSLKLSLNGHQSVVTALTKVMDVLYVIILSVLVLIIFDVPVMQVYVPLGTILVSMSFAIGSSISNIVSSLIFVIVTRPYDVGDRVTASCFMNGEETLIVKRIDVLTTTFLRVINKEVTVPNWQLLASNIENFKRSPPAVMKLEVSVSYMTTAYQLEGLRRRVNAYLETQALAWKPVCTVRTAFVRDQSIGLTLWVQSHHSWQDAPKLFKANFHLWMHLLAAMRELGIHFRMADQAIRVEGSLGLQQAAMGAGAVPTSKQLLAAASSITLGGGTPQGSRGGTPTPAPPAMTAAAVPTNISGAKPATPSPAAQPAAPMPAASISSAGTLAHAATAPPPMIMMVPSSQHWMEMMMSMMAQQQQQRSVLPLPPAQVQAPSAAVSGPEAVPLTPTTAAAAGQQLEGHARPPET